MEIRQLQALVTVAEVGSVTKAAQLLHLVQPAVTRQIRNLEVELGVELFERTRVGMKPTAAGEVLTKHARRALLELQRARLELQAPEGDVSGVAAVGILGSVEELLAPALVEAVRTRHPAIELRILTAYSGHLQQWLDDGDIDVSLLYNLSGGQSSGVLPILRDELWAVASRSEQLRIDTPVDLATALRQPLIMPAADQGHGIRMLIDQARVGAGIEPAVAVQTNSMSLQIRLAGEGHGWTILPAAGVALPILRGELSAAPIRNPSITRTVALGFARSGKASPAVKAVAAELVRIAKEAVEEGTWPSATWLL